jgi:hypothetical protein
LNIKRLAYEITPAANRFERAGSGTGAAGAVAPGQPAAARSMQTTVISADAPAAARPMEARPAETTVSPDSLARRIDQFLGTRGYRPEPPSGFVPPAGRPTPSRSVPAPGPSPVDFVCEEDVRLAIRAGRKIVVSERAIVTPAARDLGEEHRVFTVTPGRG